MSENSLKKFNRLPREVRDKLSLPEYLGVIEDLENKYATKLANVFISLVVSDLTLIDLESHLESSLRLNPDQAREIQDVFAQLLIKFKSDFPQDVSRITDEERANFAFSVEDEEEIKKMPSLSGGDKKYNYEELAYLIIDELRIKVQDEIIKKRLVNIIIARLKDVRDDLETMEALTKSRKVGGMELSVEIAEKIFGVIKKKISQGLIKNEPIGQTSNPISFPSQKPFISNGQSLGEKRNMEVKRPEPSLPPKPNLPAPPLPKPAVVEQALPQIKEEEGLPVFDSPAELPADIPKPPVAPPRPKPTIAPTPQPQHMPDVNQNRSLPPRAVSPTSKPRLDDVKMSKSLMSPIDELAKMTLIDFRRLGDSPEAMTAKIKEKIVLLEQESYGKRIEGINAWQKNEVSTFYRLLGQKSMMDGKSIDDIIGERLNQKKPTLSLEEFESIMELNKDLRY